MNLSQPIPPPLVLGVSIVLYVLIVLKHAYISWTITKFWNSDSVRVRGRSLTILFFTGLFGSETLLTAFAILGRNRPGQDFTQTPVAQWDGVMWVGLTLLPSIMSVLMGPLALKSWVLMFNLQIAREQLELANQRDHEQNTVAATQWYSTRRHLISEKSQVAIVLSWTLLCFVSTLGFWVTMNFIPGEAALIVQGLVLSSVFAYCGHKITRSMMDFWKIKKEVYTYAVSWTLSVFILLPVAFTLWGKRSTLHNSWKTFMLYLAVILCSQFLLSVVTIRPLLKLDVKRRRRRKGRTPSFSPDDDDRTITSPTGNYSMTEGDDPFPEFFVKHRDNLFFQLLNKPDFEEVFKNHLASEFSLENLLFLTAVRRLYEKCAAVYASEKEDMHQFREVFAQAGSIEKCFLSANSVSALNISFALRDKAELRLRKIQEDFDNQCSSGKNDMFAQLKALLIELSQVFLPAATDVFFVLQNDSFRRFKTTKEYTFLQSKQLAIMVVETEQAKSF